ncbi:putative glycosyltransferase [Anopheles sinensis]|uniref:Putative glycosyltransferase n=1 Tax=Anopheles sinensis TaxID=74873 RepID=A0A084W3N5_ANOSI|nr:putative glycosyltransferase [Anopheles sinensis]
MANSDGKCATQREKKGKEKTIPPARLAVVMVMIGTFFTRKLPTGRLRLASVVAFRPGWKLSTAYGLLAFARPILAASWLVQPGLD